jgi:hypothetical protein
MNTDPLSAVDFKLFLCDIEDCVFPQACEYTEYPTLAKEIDAIEQANKAEWEDLSRAIDQERALCVEEPVLSHPLQWWALTGYLLLADEEEEEWNMAVPAHPAMMGGWFWRPI